MPRAPVQRYTRRTVPPHHTVLGILTLSLAKHAEPVVSPSPATMRIVAHCVCFAACVAAALATGALTPAASGKPCDEARTYNILSAAAGKEPKCGDVVYNPKLYRCCGKELRRLSTNRLSLPLNRDPNFDETTDSQFCYGKQHVSSRQLVCGGAIYDAGEWDEYGRQTKWNACCQGTLFEQRVVECKPCCAAATARAGLTAAGRV